MKWPVLPKRPSGDPSREGQVGERIIQTNETISGIFSGQELVTYEKGIVEFTSKLYTRTIGFGLAAVVIISLLATLIWTGRNRVMRVRDLAPASLGLFAVSALYRNWSISRFEAKGT